MGFVGAFVAGVVVWTWLEYMLHRWVFHRRVLGRIPSREHLKHHAKVDWFAPWSSKLALAVPALALLSGLGVLGAGAAGAGLPAGTFAGWLVYEWIHRRIHVTAPRNAYERWARAHHLSHHFGRSHANPSCCCWTNPWLRLTRPPAPRSAATSGATSPSSPAPPSS